VIPNGLRAPAPRPKRRFVLSAGRVWDEAKNVAALERLAPRLPWPVRVVGEGSSIGHVPARELERWYAEAAIFALPASYEPFGLAALEAGAAGCALVLGDIPSLREVWGDAALYVEPRDDEELERALRRLIADKALRVDLARAARDRAAKYTPERMAEAYLDVYERLLVAAELPAVEAR
jgi:glycosyltransferase involved in cell wall biosynthesis